jgi:tetratricopeptide (TPR) repeat protein
MGPIDLAARALKKSRLFVLAGALCACAHLRTLTAATDALSPGEHMTLGASYETQGLKKEAAAQYEAAAKMDSADPEAEVALGNLAFADGDFKSAETRYLRALKRSPRHAGAENNLAMTYLSEGIKLDEAEKLAQEALDQGGPLRPYILDTLASIRLRRSRVDAKEAKR